MFKGDRFRIADQRLDFVGISFGYGIAAFPVLVAREGPYMIIREPASTDWSGRGTTGQSPSRWYLMRVEEIEGKCPFQIDEVLKELEPGKYWQRAKKELIKLMKERIEAEERKNV